MIEGNLREQRTRRIPSDAPAFFFVDIQSTQMPAFEKAIAAIPGAGPLDKVPSLRGRITRIGGKPVNEIAVPPDARWAIDGDRGVTYSATPPEGSRIVAGEWWPADYRGPQLISFDEALARARRGDGPTFIECVTFRFRGHYFGDRMPYIPKEQLAEAMAADPVPRFRTHLIDDGICSDDELNGIDEGALISVEESLKAVLSVETIVRPQRASSCAPVGAHTKIFRRDAVSAAPLASNGPSIVTCPTWG